MVASKPFSKSAILRAVRDAMARSQAGKGAKVEVALPGWEGYYLVSYKAFTSKVAQYPSTLVKVRHEATGATCWDTTAAYLDTLAARMAQQAKEHDGWCGPATSTWIPTDHPAHNWGVKEG